jgi:ABC-type antimicrobial peptide transport system permease subunit
LTYVASLRRREVGLRLAIGAVRGDIVAQFVLKALHVVGAACVAGLALSFAFTGALSGMLYGISRFDPATLTGVIALVVAMSAVAALVPAMRAARVDPMQTLREE